MGIGPVKAVPKVLKQAGLSINDIGLIELRAFASQSRRYPRIRIKSGYRERKWGAIAMGHPLGCTGAKLSVQFDEMKRRGDKYGIVTMWVQVAGSL
jgi:acetyl-CoA acyltransferase